MTSSSKPIRWWPLTAILILAALGLFVISFMDAGHRQDRVFFTALVIVVTLFLSVLWLLLLSRMRWRRRLGTLVVLILAISLALMLFPFKGFDGDLVPIFEWRWRAEPTTFRHASENTATTNTDYPQFLGPARNAVVTGIQLETDWETHPPQLIWRQPIGAGWSSFAVVGNSAITQEQAGDLEKVVCYELTTGAVKWSHEDQARFNAAPAGLGPRATPTISGDRVYTLGATGILNCLALETGDLLWTQSIFEEHSIPPPPWGGSTSPLLFGELVIVSAGGAVAYHAETGERVWKGHTANTAYSSAVLATLAGTEQIVLFSKALITAHEPMSGELLWQQPWEPEQYTEAVAQPLPLSDDQILFSTSYGVGAKLYELSRNSSGEFDVSVVWETLHLKAKFTTIIHYEGYLYGLDDGIFTCVDPADGTRQWKQGRYGHGQTLRVSDVLLVLSESGDVALVAPDPSGYKEYGRFAAVKGKTWNTPALAGDYLLVRNDREAACYQLPTRKTN